MNDTDPDQEDNLNEFKATMVVGKLETIRIEPFWDWSTLVSSFLNNKYQNMTRWLQIWPNAKAKIYSN